jgi:tetratricopeptide (TPR) repeat protein
MPTSVGLLHRAAVAVMTGLALVLPASGGESILTAEREEAAFRELRSLIETNSTETAHWLAGVYAGIAERGGSLKHATEWRAAATEIYQARQYQDGVHNMRYRARSAATIGANDLAIKLYLGAVQLDEDGNNRASDARQAAVLAARAGDYTRAAQLFDLVEKHGMEWVKELGKKRAAQLRDFEQKKDDPQAVLDFVRGFWIGDSPGEGIYYEDAIRMLRALLAPPSKLPDKVREEVMHLMEDYLRKSGDQSALDEWMRQALLDVRGSPAKRAEVLFRMGFDLYQRGRLEEALQHFRQVAEVPGAKSWPEAVFNAGFILKQQGRPEEAIRTFARLLSTNVNNQAESGDIMSPFKNYQCRACTETAHCHESLHDFKSARKFAQFAGAKYHYDTWCGTCARGHADEMKQWTEMLDVLANLESTDARVIAAAAGKLLAAGNSHARRVLVQCGASAIDAAVKVSRSEERKSRLAAIATLEEIGANATSAGPRLVEMLKDEDEGVAAQAAKALGSMGPKGRVAVPALIAALGDPRKVVRVNAMQSMRDLKIDREHVPLMLAALQSDNKTQAEAANDLLDKVGNLGADAVPELLRIAAQNPDRPNDGIQRTLIIIGEPALMPVAMALREFLKRPAEQQGRWELLFLHNTLRCLAPSATNRINELAALVKQQADTRVTGFQEALSASGPAALPALTDMLCSTSSTVRCNAAYCVFQMGAVALPLEPVLIERARAAENDEMRLVMMALARIGTRSRESVELFVKGLDNEDGIIARDSAQALGQLGHEVDEARPGLRKMIGHPDWGVKRSAEEALARMDMLARIKQ